MALSIRYKLFFALLLATGTLVAGTAVFMNWSFKHGFVRYISERQQERINVLVGRLADVYAEDNGWQRLAEDQRRWVGVLFADRGRLRAHYHHRWAAELAETPRLWPPPRSRNGEKERRFRAVELRVMLLDADRSIIYGTADQADRLELHPIVHQERTVGYLGVLPGPALERLGELNFLTQQSQSFVVIALAMVVLCAALALPLANRLVRPLRAFTDGSRALAAGRYDTRIPVSSGDELGQLARDFNDLAKALEGNERLRRQWVADISHELRTPLAVLRGEIEAVQDGVRPLERQTMDSLHGDVIHLGRLVEDLYELSMSDLGALHYQKRPTDPVAVLEDDVAALECEFHVRHITVSLQNHLSGKVTLRADADRLSQLFRNLLSNTLRYTDSGGRLEIGISKSAETLVIDFQDSAPGVAEEDVPRLFERFFRVEASRNRELGGAGLGLAICRNIVEAHHGQIRARTSPLGGLWIHLEFPCRA